MLGVIERMMSLFMFIGSEEAVEYGRNYKGAFTRKSPLNFQNMVLLHLNQHNLTLYMEIRNFFKKIDGIKATTQAFSQARDKLNPLVFKKLKDHHLKDFYASDSVKKFKNHLIISWGMEANALYLTKNQWLGFLEGLKINSTK